MSIKLCVAESHATSLDDYQNHEFAESDITVGSYNNDSLKLDHQKLRGQHIRISRQWDDQSNTFKLVVTNISGSEIVTLNDQPLHSDEMREINGSTRICMGDYKLFAKTSRESMLDKPSKERLSFEHFAPNDLALDNAIQSLLSRELTESRPEPVPTYEPIAHTESATFEDTLDLEDVSMTTEHEIEPLTEPQPAAEEATADTLAATNVVRMPAPMPETHSDNDAASDAEPQLLFKAVVGCNDIIDLDFNAFRLYTLSGKLTHHGKPLANATIDAGPLGKTTSNENGDFFFANIIENSEYKLTVSCEGYRCLDDGMLQGTVSEDLSITLNAIKLSTVSGHLIHQGKPLSGVTLSADEYGVCVSDHEGKFEFHNIPENTELKISVNHAGFLFKSTAEDIPTGKLQTPVSPVMQINEQNEKTVKTPASQTVHEEDSLEASLAALVGPSRSVA